MSYEIVWVFMITLMSAACGVNFMAGLLIKSLLGGHKTPISDYWPYAVFVLLVLVNPWYNIFSHLSLPFK